MSNYLVYMLYRDFVDLTMSDEEPNIGALDSDSHESSGVDPDDELPSPAITRNGRYWYIGMAHVPDMRNTNMHGKISAKTERLVVKGCYYHYSAVSLSNKPKNLTRNHR